MIEVKNAGARGRGVFAQRAFSPGEQIELCPVLPIPPPELAMIDRTVLYAYYFGWQDGGAIACGYGSFYNHSDQPNARYEKNFDRLELVFLAAEPIEPGDEITIRYNTGTAESALWFDPV